MYYWIPYAFVRIVVFFIAGILLSWFAPVIPLVSAACAFAALLVVYLLLWFLNFHARRRRVNTGLTGLLAIFVAGYLAQQLNNESNSSDHLLHQPGVEWYTAQVVAPPQGKENSWRHVVEVQAVRSQARWQNASGRVVVYLPRKFYSAPFQYGDVILVKGAPATVRGPLNPGEFDYQKFLAQRNIFHQQFLRGPDATFVSTHVPNHLLARSFEIREWAAARIRAVVDDDRELSIALALVLGMADGIDPETAQSYAATGAMHVLAVSGLHVGIIYLIIGFALRPMRKVKHGVWFVTIVSISLLWLYACVTGLSPSVLRAVTMFSFVALAQPLKHHTNIYNTLGASAFLLLLFDPMLILSVGFQLSYLAVVGIVCLQPVIYRWFEPENRLLDEIWKITSVSIAAQASTLGISLLYFHQFPNYFFISNLYVIPLAFVILIAGLGVVAFGSVVWVGAAIGWSLSMLIRLLNFLITLTEGLPGAVTHDIYITPLQCLLLMLMIVAVTLLFLLRSIRFYYLLVLLSVAFGGVSWWIHSTGFQSRRLTVYAVSGHSAVDLIEGGAAHFFGDSILFRDSRKTGFHLTPNRLRSRVSVTNDGEKLPACRTFAGGRVISWHGRIIMQLHEVPDFTRRDLQVDYLILSGRAARQAEKVLRKIKPRKIILDSSNSYFVADKVYNSLTQQYQIHSVWHHGAFDIIL